MSETAAPSVINDPLSRGWDAELVESLYDLLDTVDTTSPALLDGLSSLEVKYEDLVYSELIFLLSHLRFDPDEAKLHWKRILEHRSQMQVAQKHAVDVRVALVSYFVEVNRQLRNPKIIEMRLFERTQDGAYRDELTGLHNYRMFREYLEQEILRSRRYGTPLSLVMIDIDNFKSWNDTHGHEAGNELLTVVASILERELRRSDVAARYGGEEFTLILPATSKTDGLGVAERAREAIECNRFPLDGGTATGRITVSVGIATFPADASEADELVQHADRAMYVAKSNGKNQVRLYGDCRRSFGRIDASLRGEFRVLADHAFPLTTLNVSEAGLLFSTEHPPAVGDLIDFDLRLPSAGGAANASGRVVHVEPGSGGSFRVAVRISEMSAGDRVALAAHLRSA